MLGFCSLHVTGLKSLSFRVVGALRSPQESFFGTISIVPCTITRARRRRSFRVVAAPAFVVSVLLFITTVSLTTQFVVEPLLQFTAHLASGGLSNLVLFSWRSTCIVENHSLRFVTLDDAFVTLVGDWRCLTASRFAASLSRGDLLSRLTCTSCKRFWRRSTTASISSSICFTTMRLADSTLALTLVLRSELGFVLIVSNQLND